MDIRWIQRLSNFKKALKQLTMIIEKPVLNDIEKQGLIQCFEYTYELAWNTIKDYYENQGDTGIQGSRDAFRLAFNRGLIEDGHTWMQMIKSRQLTSHTYKEEIAEKVGLEVKNIYYPEFVKLNQKFSVLEQEKF